jgi:hypothetical protein
MEHRWGSRSALDTEVRLRLICGAADAGRIKNASLSGALVRTARRLPVFARVLVEFERGSTRGRERECVPAYVVRAAPDGVGLEWSEFAPPAIATLLERTNSDCELAYRPRRAGYDTAHLSQ